MTPFVSKLREVLGSDRRKYRIVSAINKSPLRYFVRTMVDISHPKIKLKRKKVMASLSGSKKIEDKLFSLRSEGMTYVSDVVTEERLKDLELFGKKQSERKEEIADKQINVSKKFWVRLSDEDYGSEKLSSQHPLVNFALQENILELAALYLGEAPFLNYVLLTESHFSDGPLEKSQLWHLDQDDTKMVKLFVYLSDVNQIGDGPFTYFDRKASCKIKNSFFKRHLRDEQVARHLDLRDKNQLMGPALTVFMADTSKCYHMGSRIHPNHQRLMYTALFTTVPYMYPEVDVRAFSIDSEVSKLQYLALRIQ